MAIIKNGSVGFRNIGCLDFGTHLIPQGFHDLKFFTDREFFNFGDTHALKDNGFMKICESLDGLDFQFKFADGNNFDP